MSTSVPSNTRNFCGLFNLLLRMMMMLPSSLQRAGLVRLVLGLAFVCNTYAALSQDQEVDYLGKLSRCIRTKYYPGYFVFMFPHLVTRLCFFLSFTTANFDAINATSYAAIDDPNTNAPTQLFSQCKKGRAPPHLLVAIQRGEFCWKRKCRSRMS